jgi:hypothetical protein
MGYHRPETRLRIFMDRVRVNENGCWIWTGAVQRTPGRSSVRPTFDRDGQRYAYRWAYEKFVGPIPSGKYVCHRCDTPLCVNPAHLFVGTAQDNSDDMMAKGRCASTKLTAEQVAAIRTTYQPGRGFKNNSTALAKQYGMSRSAICRLLKKTTYKFVEAATQALKAAE